MALHPLPPFHRSHLTLIHSYLSLAYSLPPVLYFALPPSPLLFFFFLMIRPPPRSPLFPYTPLFRSKLPFVVPGPKAAYEKARPYLDMIGAGSSYVGEGELARIAKICHNVHLGVVIQSLEPAPIIDRKSTRLNSSH